MKAFYKILKDCFLVQNSNIENATFSYKTTLSDTNIKTGRMGSAKWAYNKEQSLCQYFFFFFLKFCCRLTP